jgi:hypothetical protein
MPATSEADKALHKPAQAPKDDELDYAEGPVVDTTNYFTMSEQHAETLPDDTYPDEVVIKESDRKAAKEARQKAAEKRDEHAQKAIENRQKALDKRRKESV